MNKILITSLTVLGCSLASASGMVEGNRLKMLVDYDDGVSAKVTCPRDIKKDCRIDIVFHGKKYKITQEMLGKNAPMVPGELVISYDRRSHEQQFVVWFEVGCDKYSELPNEYYICMANVAVEKGMLEKLTTFRRTINDDYLDRKSMDLSVTK
jgi:hypothetical protein